MAESLYYEQGDGEVFVIECPQTHEKTMVTCIDICSLYRNKRGKAITQVEALASLRHKNLVEIRKYWVVTNQLIFVEMECPENVS